MRSTLTFGHLDVGRRGEDYLLKPDFGTLVRRGKPSGFYRVLLYSYNS